MTRSAPQAPVRERLVATALKLFYEKGSGNVGVNEVTEAAGVAKMSLYNNFSSKDELLVAALEQRTARNRLWLDGVIGGAKTPRAALVAIFEQLGDWLGHTETRGCLLVNTVAEIANLNHPAHKLAQAYKFEVRDRMRALARQAGLRHPDVLADQLLILLDGCNATAAIRADIGFLGNAAKAAKALIEAAA